MGPPHALGCLCKIYSINPCATRVTFHSITQLCVTCHNYNLPTQHRSINHHFNTASSTATLAFLTKLCHIKKIIIIKINHIIFPAIMCHITFFFGCWFLILCWKSLVPQTNIQTIPQLAYVASCGIVCVFVCGTRRTLLCLFLHLTLPKATKHCHYQPIRASCS